MLLGHTIQHHGPIWFAQQIVTQSTMVAAAAAVHTIVTMWQLAKLGFIRDG
jgi:hypothetical protein